MGLRSGVLKTNTFKLKAMIFMVGSYFVVELVGGIIFGSLAVRARCVTSETPTYPHTPVTQQLQADAFHMAGDLLALSIGMYAEKLRIREAPNAT